MFAHPFVQAQIKENTKASLAGGFPVDSPHKGPVTQKMFPYVDVIMVILLMESSTCHYMSWYSVRNILGVD